MSNDEGMTKQRMAKKPLWDSSFVIDSDFVILVSSFRRGSKESNAARRVICGKNFQK
jgi:hypothetical protein